jgi:hypothetical protein
VARTDIVPADKLLRILNEFGTGTVRAMRTGFGRVMDEFEKDAVEVTPVKSGNLESSTVVRTRRRGSVLDGELKFSAPYAAQVHELPENARGPRTRAKPGNAFGVAGPKWLERTLRGWSAGKFAEQVGELLQKEWARRARR